MVCVLDFEVFGCCVDTELEQLLLILCVVVAIWVCELFLGVVFALDFFGVTVVAVICAGCVREFLSVVFVVAFLVVCVVHVVACVCDCLIAGDVVFVV